MSQKQLDNLVRIGQLKAEPPSEAECQGLLRSGVRRLVDSEREELSSLRKECRELRRERDFLRQATAYFAKAKR